MQDITPLCWIELVLHVLDSKLWLEELQITLCELEVKCNPLKGFVILHHSSFADEALSTVLTVRLSLSHHNAEQQEYLFTDVDHLQVTQGGIIFLAAEFALMSQ